VPAIHEPGRKFTTPRGSVIVVNEFIRIYQGVFFKTEAARIYFSQNMQECHGENIICIGGPVHNKFAKNLINNLRDRNQIPHYFDDHSLISAASRKQYNSTSVDRKIVTYVCLVIITRNPYGGSGKRVLLLAECRGYGAIGLAKYLGSGDLIRDLRKQSPYRSRTLASFTVSFHNENGQMDALYSNYAIEEFHKIQ